jgi:hypothetical protein
MSSNDPNELPVRKFFIAVAIIVLVFLLVLTGCSTTVPVSRKFPEAPTELRTLCPELKTLPPDTTRLSDVVSTVVENYAHYHECSARVELWNEWYTRQREIFESVK